MPLYCFCMQHITVLCSVFECWAPEHSCVSCDSDTPATAIDAVSFTYKYSLKNCSLTFFFGGGVVDRCYLRYDTV